MNPRENFRNRWALVTGASSGIGQAIARELASCGARLVLVARRGERLEALAAELARQGVASRILVADLNDPAAPAAIFAATADLEIEILVNNAGLGQYSAFASCDLEQELSQVRVNCLAAVHLTRLYLPVMAARKRGWLLFVASTASFQPVPYLTTYAATKAFDRFFAEGLAAEASRYGVRVTALCPGPTESSFFDVARSQAYSERPRQPAGDVARQAIDALARGRRVLIPYLQGRISITLARFLPSLLVGRFLERYGRPRG